VGEIRTLRGMWRAFETGSSLKIYAPALDSTGFSLSVSPMPAQSQDIGGH
jgi:hypothetical protein